LRQRSICLDEGFLCDVFNLGRVTHDARYQAHKLALVLGNQKFERMLVTALRSLHQKLINITFGQPPTLFRLDRDKACRLLACILVPASIAPVASASAVPQEHLQSPEILRPDGAPRESKPELGCCTATKSGKYCLRQHDRIARFQFNPHALTAFPIPMTVGGMDQAGDTLGAHDCTPAHRHGKSDEQGAHGCEPWCDQ
jgi:hypothetical protein